MDRKLCDSKLTWCFHKIIFSFDIHHANIHEPYISIYKIDPFENVGADWWKAKKSQVSERFSMISVLKNVLTAF